MNNYLFTINSKSANSENISSVRICIDSDSMLSAISTFVDVFGDECLSNVVSINLV